jgi:hypothetical protein
MANASATGHDDTGVFANTLFAGCGAERHSPTPCIENDAVLGELDALSAATSSMRKPSYVRTTMA